MKYDSLPDFDTLMAMARQDPAGLNALKQEMTEALIEQAPAEHQKRLCGIQFQIDMEVRRSKGPVDACIRVSDMMHDSFGQLRNQLTELTQTRSDYSAESPTTPVLRKAQVLPFSF